MPDDAVMKITTRREQGKMFTSGQRIPLVHRRQQIRFSGDAPMFLLIYEIQVAYRWPTGCN
jgi:hypothetical protein